VEAGRDEWGRVVGDRGWTLAHKAAEAGSLPPDFDRWDIANDYGWTVAHVAAEVGTLPPDFNRWDLADNYGRTVVDAAASRRVRKLFDS
jgi:hypothetical protein